MKKGKQEVMEVDAFVKNAENKAKIADATKRAGLTKTFITSKTINDQRKKFGGFGKTTDKETNLMFHKMESEDDASRFGMRKRGTIWRV
jgi:hypothetical protein